MSIQRSFRLFIFGVLLIAILSCKQTEVQTTQIKEKATAELPKETAPAAKLGTKVDEAMESTEAKDAKAVDANGDGIIDENDVDILIEKANTFFAENMRTPLKKAGVEIDEKGQLIDEDPKSKVEANLTPAEQRKLNEAGEEWKIMSAQIQATRRASEKNTADNIAKLFDALEEWKKLNADIQATLKKD